MRYEVGLGLAEKPFSSSFQRSIKYIQIMFFEFSKFWSCDGWHHNGHVSKRNMLDKPVQLISWKGTESKIYIFMMLKWKLDKNKIKNIYFGPPAESKIFFYDLKMKIRQKIKFWKTNLFLDSRLSKKYIFYDLKMKIG